ncbi:MAG: DNA-3-methyladenine glycosylase I [Gammaproteobacteria bacterium]|nr:DNA-3-methyladenine glycosylase I [Gammaproteobacteria bacterium]
MKPFSDIHARAAERKGGHEALAGLLPTFLADDELARLGDDRCLAMMAQTINQAGFNWTVIANKWPEFEEAFFGFDIERLSGLSPEQWEAYTKDRRVVRNWQKIKAVMENLGFILDTAREHGSFSRFLAAWPSSDQVGLLQALKKRGSRLGGHTGQWFLRYVGKDSFVTTRDVTLALRDAGVDIADDPTSQRDLKRIQAAFNAWHDETGLPYTHLSKIAAYSIGTNYENDDIMEEMAKFPGMDDAR